MEWSASGDEVRWADLQNRNLCILADIHIQPTKSLRQLNTYDGDAFTAGADSMLNQIHKLFMPRNKYLLDFYEECVTHTHIQ